MCPARGQEWGLNKILIEWNSTQDRYAPCGREFNGPKWRRINELLGGYIRIDAGVINIGPDHFNSDQDLIKGIIIFFSLNKGTLRETLLALETDHQRKHIYTGQINWEFSSNEIGPSINYIDTQVHAIKSNLY